MKGAVAAIFVLLLTAAAPPTPQRPVWLQQYSWAQVQELEARITEYATRDRIKTQMLRAAVAQSVGASAKRMTFDRLIATVDEKSKTAARLEVAVSELRGEVRRLSSPGMRDPAAAALARGEAALSAGRLDEAAAEFARLDTLRADQTAAGQKAWGAAIDARVDIANLRSRHDEAAALSRRKFDLALATAVPAIDQAWDGLDRQAFSLRRKADESGDIEPLRAIVRIYQVDMPAFLTRFPDTAREYKRRMLLGEALSSLALRASSPDGYREPNRLLREYVDYHASRNDCPDCIVGGISLLANNIASEIYRTRDASLILPLVPYMELLIKVPEARVSATNRFSLYYSMANLFGMAGQANRRRDTFDQAFTFLARMRALAGNDPQRMTHVRFLTGDVLRQRGEALGDIADMERARQEYLAVIPDYKTRRMSAGLGLTYKRLGHVEYVMALTRKSCPLLRESDRSLAAGMAIIEPQDFPDEHKGFAEMQRRNQAASAQLCR